MSAIEDRPAPGASAYVRRLLKSPPAAGLMVVALGPLARAQGLEEGDIIVRFAGLETRDHDEYYEAHKEAHKTKGVAELVVLRGGVHLKFKADRAKISRDFGGVRQAQVRKGVPLPPRPRASVKTLTALKSGTFDLWFAWESPGYKHKDRYEKKGFEHHVLEVGRSFITLTSEVGYDSFGVHRFSSKESMAADGTARGAEYVLEAPKFTYACEAKASKTSWIAAMNQPPQERTARYPAPADLVPSVFAFFLPALLPRKVGAGFGYTPAPGSPLIQHAFPRTVVCRGREQIDWGRETRWGWKYEHVCLDAVVATTWTDEDGAVLRYSERGHRATLATRELATLKLVPKL